MARVEYLQSKAAERVITTVEDIARQLDDDRQFARDHKEAAVAVSATMGKAKVLGLIVEKHQVGLTTMTYEEMLDSLDDPPKDADE